MARDIAMIFSVLLSVVSVGFGLYKNIEAGNARGFAYEQAYRIMGIVQEANIGPVAKANILDQAMDALQAPPPVLDLSRSSADVPTVEVCADEVRALCSSLATRLADVNSACVEAKDMECAAAVELKQQVFNLNCVTCY